MKYVILLVTCLVSRGICEQYVRVGNQCAENLLSSATVPSKLRCGGHCHSTAACSGFCYDASTSSCSLYKMLSFGGGEEEDGFKSYKYFSEVKNHAEAYQACITAEGFLGLPTSTAETTFMLSMVTRLGTSNIWIGVDDRTTERTYERAGTNTAVTYTNWATNEPSDSTGRENCIELWRNAVGKWNDHVCSITKPYICQFPTPGSCTDLNMDLGESLKCYRRTVTVK